MPRHMEDLTGRVFGRLTVISFSHSDHDNSKFWNCVCSCNPNQIIEKRGESLKKNKYPSCGCWSKAMRRHYNQYDLSGNFGIGYIGDKEFYFDLDDYNLIKERSWCVRDLNYVVSRFNKKIISMHRLIMGFPEGLDVDHIDGNTLNNRKSNLRSVTHRQNSQNRKKIIKKTSVYNGVYYDKRARGWVSRIHDLQGKSIWLGVFVTEKEAAIAYDQKAIELGYLTRNVLQKDIFDATY